MGPWIGAPSIAIPNVPRGQAGWATRFRSQEARPRVVRCAFSVTEHQISRRFVPNCESAHNPALRQRRSAASSPAHHSNSFFPPRVRRWPTAESSDDAVTAARGPQTSSASSKRGTTLRRCPRASRGLPRSAASCRERSRCATAANLVDLHRPTTSFEGREEDLKVDLAAVFVEGRRKLCMELLGRGATSGRTVRCHESVVCAGDEQRCDERAAYP